MLLLNSHPLGGIILLPALCTKSPHTLFTSAIWILYIVNSCLVANNPFGRILKPFFATTSKISYFHNVSSYICVEE